MERAHYRSRARDREPRSRSRAPSREARAAGEFLFNDATLTSEAKAQLEGDGLPKIVAIREMRYVVQGHADRLGTAAYNQRLSERRARAVRGYLVEKGVPTEQIQAVGLGASMPQTSCEQKNRRVTVEIEPPPL